MLEEESEHKHQFGLENGAPSTYGKGEYDHRKSGYGCHEEPELEYVDEQSALGCAFAEIGENECCHAEVGECTENGEVALQDSEGSELYDSKVIGDEILDNNRNTLDEDVDQGYKNTDFNVL